MVKRFDCLKLLASWLDEHALTVTSRGGNAREWAYLRPQGANFHSLNMGTCMSFAVGLALAYPKRKVIAIDSDGSLLLDTSSLVTVADVNPPNFLALVFDNQAYANMGATATARATDLARMAQGAEVKKAAAITSNEDFAALVKPALANSELGFFVLKSESAELRSKSIHA